MGIPEPPPDPFELTSEPSDAPTAGAEDDEQRRVVEQSEGVLPNLPGGGRSDDRDERVESGDVGRERPYEG